MARSKPSLTVRVAPDAAEELEEIWCWNAERYSPDHADRYLAFLRQAIFAIDVNHRFGKQVEARPELHWILVRARAKGHGHLAVYRIMEATIDVLHIFHSAQDWPTKLAPATPNE